MTFLQRLYHGLSVGSDPVSVVRLMRQVVYSNFYIPLILQTSGSVLRLAPRVVKLPCHRARHLGALSAMSCAVTLLGETKSLLIGFFRPLANAQVFGRIANLHSPTLSTVFAAQIRRPRPRNCFPPYGFATRKRFSVAIASGISQETSSKDLKDA